MTLIVFIVPVIPLFPLKLVGLWLLANEYWVSAIVTIVFAKFLGVGVAAFIFDVTRPKLLEMPWFQRLYELGDGVAGEGRRDWSIRSNCGSRKSCAATATAGPRACCG